MNALRLVTVLALTAGLCGCVTPHQEDAKLRMPWPAAPQADLLAYAAPHPDYPTVGGDILKGTSPVEAAPALSPTPAPVRP
jgi:hypothetical protein